MAASHIVVKCECDCFTTSYIVSECGYYCGYFKCCKMTDFLRLLFTLLQSVSIIVATSYIDTL